MNRAQAITLLEFSAWANRRVFSKAARLSTRTLHRAARLSYPTPIATLVHILDTQWYWREGAQFGNLPIETLRPSSFPTLNALRIRWDKEDRLFVAFVRSLTDRELAGRVTYTWPRARARRRPLWHIIMHVVNHATQHRSELAVFLTTKGLSPRNLDFLDFIRSVRKKRS